MDVLCGHYIKYILTSSKNILNLIIYSIKLKKKIKMEDAKRYNYLIPT